MCLEGTTPKDIPHHCISANSSDRPGRHLSIATIRVYFCDDNGDNLRQLEVVLGAIGNELIFAHELLGNIFAHELHELTRRLCDTRMATGSVARIVTNAMRALFTCPVAYCLPGTSSSPRLSGHCVPGYHRFALYCLPGRSPSTKYFCPRIARIDTNSCNGINGDRVGRTNLHECKEFFIYMSCGVVPSRHIVLASPIRALRTRLPSLRSVVPSRHSSSPKSNYH